MKGFRDVPQGVAGTGAALVLPESNAVEGIISDIQRNGVLQQRQKQADDKKKADLNKSYAENTIKEKPSVLFNDEIRKYVDKWYQDGVNYRKQGFDVFNPDYNDPNQVEAHKTYVQDQKTIEGLLDFRDALDKDYSEKEKMSMQGNLGGFEDYQKHLGQNEKGNRLRELYESGGISQLPNLYKPFDMAEFDKGWNLKPKVALKEVPTADGGGVEIREHEYIDIPEAKSTVEQLMVNDPAYKRELQKKGISDPRQLFTFGGRNMIRNQEDPEDYGKIDEDAIYRQLSESYVSRPDLAKELPEGVKRKMLGGLTGNPMSPWQSSTNLLDIFQDPEYKSFLDKKMNDQLNKERAYHNEIIGAIGRKATGTELRDKVDYDYSKGNYAMSQQRLGLSKQGLELSKQRLELSKQRDGKGKADDLQAHDARTNFIDSIRSGDEKSLNRFAGMVGSKNARVSIKGDVMTIDYYTTDEGKTKKILKKREQISLKNDGGKAHMWRLLDDLEGKTIPINKSYMKDYNKANVGGYSIEEEDDQDEWN